MIHKRESSSLRLVVTLIHLALFAELGVLTRAMLAKFFTLGCSGGWGPCLEGGRYFKDLPANMLGCFVIGLFAASSTLGLATTKALALLPAGHAWQTNFELQIGIRTGYCGSLTTFGSWQLDLVVLAVNSQKWVEAIIGYVSGLAVPLVCYYCGMHVALGIDRWVLGDTRVLQEMEQYRTVEVQYLEGLRADSGELPSQQLMMQAEPDLPRLIRTSTSQQQQQQARAEGLRRVSNGATAGKLELGPAPATGVGVAATNGAPADGAAAVAAGRTDLKLKQVRKKEPQLTMQGLCSSLHGYRTDAAALLLLAVFTALLAVGAGMERRHQWLRTAWFSCLLGPPGCILRWYLSRFNYKLPGGWAWLPAGTLAANMLGCLIDFALQCIQQRRGASLTYWGAVLIAAVQAGTCGSLTTVSTWATEVAKLADAIPEDFRAYSYAAMSIAGGFVLGLAVYGWSVWAP